MNNGNDNITGRDRRLEELRTKYSTGSATGEEVHEFWVEALKDPEQLELLKTEVDLRSLDREKFD